MKTISLKAHAFIIFGFIMLIGIAELSGCSNEETDTLSKASSRPEIKEEESVEYPIDDMMPDEFEMPVADQNSVQEETELLPSETIIGWLHGTDLDPFSTNLKGINVNITLAYREGAGDTVAQFYYTESGDIYGKIYKTTDELTFCRFGEEVYFKTKDSEYYHITNPNMAVLFGLLDNLYLAKTFSDAIPTGYDDERMDLDVNGSYKSVCKRTVFGEPAVSIHDYIFDSDLLHSMVYTYQRTQPNGEPDEPTGSKDMDYTEAIDILQRFNGPIDFFPMPVDCSCGSKMDTSCKSSCCN